MYGRRAGPAFNDPNDLLWQVGTNQGGNTTKAISWAVTDTWTVSPNMLVTGGFGYLKNPFLRNPHPFLTSWSDHGSDIVNDPGCQDLAFSVAGRGGIRVWDRCSVRSTHSWEINGALKWVRGKHDMSIGGLYSKHHADSTPAVQSTGSFAFTGAFTGIGAADVVLGRPASYQVGDFGVGRGSQRTLAAAYFNDNYRVTQRLTLNLGVRWDPGHAARNKIQPGALNHSWIQPGQKSTRFVNAPPGILYWGDAGMPDASMFTRWSQFAPRFGFAYDPTGRGKWAIRGGVGGYFGQFQEGGNSLSATGGAFLPFPGGNVTVVNPPNLIFPWNAPPYNGQIGIPLPEPTADVAVPTPLDGWPADPRTKMPNTWNWSLTIERNMGRGVLLRGSYVSSRGTHLIGGEGFNLPVFIPGGSTLANRHERRPDPNFTSLNIASGNSDSYYHSLQVTAEKRSFKGLTFLVNYTLAKSIDTASNDIGWGGAFGNQDPRGPAFNRGLSEWDRTHVVNSSMVWELPGLTGGNPVARHIVSHWEISAMVFLRSGNPFTPVSSVGNSLSPGKRSVDRADRVPGVDPRVTGRNRHEIINLGYFNQAAFTDPVIGTRGNVGRSVMRGPGFAGTDFMLARYFPISEGVRLQFRSEFFNLFNSVNFRTIRGSGSPAFTNVSNPNFGKLAVVGAQDPRILQFGLKLIF